MSSMKLFILALLFNNAFVSSQKFTRKFKNSNLVISQGINVVLFLFFYVLNVLSFFFDPKIAWA